MKVTVRFKLYRTEQRTENYTIIRHDSHQTTTKAVTSPETEDSNASRTLMSAFGSTVIDDDEHDQQGNLVMTMTTNMINEGNLVMKLDGDKISDVVTLVNTIIVNYVFK